MDLENIGVSFTLTTLEVASLGHWLSSASGLIREHLNLSTKPSLRALLDGAGRIAIATSYQILPARQEKHWPLGTAVF